MEKLKNQIDKIKDGKLAWHKGFYGDGEWKKHVEQMNHRSYPYCDIHQDALNKYALNLEYSKDPMFDPWRDGSNHNSIIGNVDEIVGVFEKIVTKRENFEIRKYLPHFVAVKNPASMLYLLSCPRWECSNDVGRAFRTQIAQWIYVQSKKEHTEGLYPSTHFHSKFWSSLKDGRKKIEDPWGFISYGVDLINPKSREDDKCITRAYKANCERINRLVSDTSRFCQIVRADDYWLRKKDNGYKKLENNIAQQIDNLAKAIAQSPSPETMIYMSTLPTSGYCQSNIPQPQFQVRRQRKGLMSKIRGLLD